ncbi:nucleotidyltransferase family protein [Paracoccus sp. T5]|uniref:nucleotidyltransferase family protein n=1 Tax=Paracoccus sp. T5 TaxID=3402161 RepID=UPI003AEB6751
MPAERTDTDLQPVILLLAAGRSSRMRGEDKLLRPISGIPQLRRIALAAVATGCPVIAALPVTGSDRRAALAGLDVTQLGVPDRDEGIAASLRAGAALAAGRALMVVQADMPELTAADMTRICHQHCRIPKALLRAESDGLPGNPVLFPADLVPALLSLTGDVGAREVVATYRHRVVLVPLPPRHATLDLDTPEEWAAWEAQYRAEGL